MMKKLQIAVFAILVLCSLPAWAASDGRGGQPGAFRDLALSGRAAAMGGAFVAIAEGATGHLYNPAGPSQSRKYDFAFSYRVMKLDRKLGLASFTIPAREEANLNFSWVYAGTSDLEARDEQGNILDGKNISHSESLISMNFSKRFSKTILVGGKLFYVQNNIGNISAYSAGVDFGGLAKFNIGKTFIGSLFPLLNVGITAENLGANYRWTTTPYWQTRGREQGATIEESFPTNFRFGFALAAPNSYTISTDLEINTASVLKTHFGGEYLIHRNLSLRAGLNDLNPTAGIGILQRTADFAVRIDIAYLGSKVEEGDDILISFDLIF